jgi:hypothetical protein
MLLVNRENEEDIDVKLCTVLSNNVSGVLCTRLKSKLYLNHKYIRYTLRISLTPRLAGRIIRMLLFVNTLRNILLLRSKNRS